VANGYRNNPDLTSQSFREGWYVTGDLGRLDEGGYLPVLGRAVDMQKINGCPVGLTDIEDSLCEHPSIRYAAAVVDPKSGLTAVAAVAWGGSVIDGRDCRAAIGRRLGDVFAASIVVIPVARVPLTEQGKPDRGAIGQLAQRTLAA
jgi:fatty-acyl-CoA synthase